MMYLMPLRILGLIMYLFQSRLLFQGWFELGRLPQYQFSDAQGKIVSGLSEGGAVTISAITQSTATGEADIPFNCVLENIPVNVSDLTIRTFFWDSLNGMQPIFISDECNP